MAGTEIPESHLAEVLDLFEKVIRAENFDLEIHYLVGRHYQGKADSRARRVYLDGLAQFNQNIQKSPFLKSDHMDLAYAIALNLLPLQEGGVDPELEKFFQIVRKSYPIHAKWSEIEKELGQHKADKARLQKLTEELRQLKLQKDLDRTKHVRKN